MVSFGDAGPQIERTYHLDIDIEATSDQNAIDQAIHLKVGILLTCELIVPVCLRVGRDDGGMVDGSPAVELATVRFYGPRSQLQKLIDLIEAWSTHATLTKDEALTNHPSRTGSPEKSMDDVAKIFAEDRQANPGKYGSS